MTQQTIDWADRRGEPREQRQQWPSSMAGSWAI